MEKRKEEIKKGERTCIHYASTSSIFKFLIPSTETLVLPGICAVIRDTSIAGMRCRYKGAFLYRIKVHRLRLKPAIHIQCPYSGGCCLIAED